MVQRTATPRVRSNRTRARRRRVRPLSTAALGRQPAIRIRRRAVVRGEAVGERSAPTELHVGYGASRPPARGPVSEPLRASPDPGMGRGSEEPAVRAGMCSRGQDPNTPASVEWVLKCIGRGGRPSGRRCCWCDRPTAAMALPSSPRNAFETPWRSALRASMMESDDAGYDHFSSGGATPCLWADGAHSRVRDRGRAPI